MSTPTTEFQRAFLAKTKHVYQTYGVKTCWDPDMYDYKTIDCVGLTVKRHGNDVETARTFHFNYVAFRLRCPGSLAVFHPDFDYTDMLASVPVTPEVCCMSASVGAHSTESESKTET